MSAKQLFNPPLVAASPPVDVVELWMVETANLSLQMQAEHVVNWIDMLMVGKTVGYWGDDWLAEAWQVRQLLLFLAKKAVEDGLAIPLTLTTPEADALAFCREARIYFQNIAHPAGLAPLADEPAISWFLRKFGPVSLFSQITALQSWLCNVSYGHSNGLWGDLAQEVIQIEAVFNSLMGSAKVQGFITPDMPSAATHPHEFAFGAWCHLGKISPHLGTGHAVIEMHNAKRMTRH